MADIFQGLGDDPNDEPREALEQRVNETVERANNLTSLKLHAGWQLVVAEIQRLRAEAEKEFRELKTAEAHVIVGAHRKVQAIDGVLTHIEQWIERAIEDAKTASKEW